MPGQSLLRFVKRWRRYEPLEKWREVPRGTRGLYVLYRQKSADINEVVYIGVAGLGEITRGGIRSRLRTHTKRKKRWTHFSFFEVHDNVTRDEIREFEALLLGIFRHDPRIELSNKQTGSRKLYQLQRLTHWR